MVTLSMPLLLELLCPTRTFSWSSPKLKKSTVLTNNCVGTDRWKSQCWLTSILAADRQDSMASKSSRMYTSRLSHLWAEASSLTLWNWLDSKRGRTIRKCLTIYTQKGSYLSNDQHIEHKYLLFNKNTIRVTSYIELLCFSIIEYVIAAFISATARSKKLPSLVTLPLPPPIFSVGGKKRNLNKQYSIYFVAKRLK